MKKQKEVIIYSTPTCHYCNMAKDYFDLIGIQYTVYDVSVDMGKKKEMVMKSDQMSVPVITIGKKVLVGYDNDAVNKALGIKLE
jgi:glutaredoxin-like YruB-family protein